MRDYVLNSESLLGYAASGGVGLIGYFVFVSVLGRSDYVQCVSEGDR